MENLSIQKGERLLQAMVKLGFDQQVVAAALGIKQPGVSDRIKGKTNITDDDATKLENKLGISYLWIMRGVEPLAVTKSAQRESNEVKSLIVDTSDKAITARFVTEVNLYAVRNKLDSKEIAEKLHISEAHWSQIKNPSVNKYVTNSMLANAVLNMSIDANYVTALVDTKAKDVIQLQEQLKQALIDNDIMRTTIQLLKEKVGDKSNEKRA